MRLALWLADIGPFPSHDFLIFRDHRADNASFGGIEARSVNEVVISDDIENKWPESANNAFKKIAKYVMYSMGAQPFLYLEPDAVILRSGAFDEIEAEYKAVIAAGKHFLGDLQDRKNNKVVPGFVPHCSGIAVYPGNLTQHAGEVFYADKVPWDIAAGRQIYPQAQQSELIAQSWNREGKGLAPFTSWQDFEQKVLSCRPKCAIFHSDKSGSLIELLRTARVAQFGRALDASVQNTTRAAGSNPAPSPENNLQTESASTSGAEQQAEGLHSRAPSATLSAPDRNSTSREADAAGAETISGRPPEKGDIWSETDASGAIINTYEFDGEKWVKDYVLAEYNTGITPWESKPDSLAEIRRLSARLKQFQSGHHGTRYVREALHDAGVITLSYRFRKRKGWKRKK